MITFPCKMCGENLKVPSSLAGTMQSCPACGAVLTVPPTSTAPVEASTEESGQYSDNAAPSLTRSSVPSQVPLTDAPPRKSRLPLVLAACGGVAVLAIIAMALVGAFKKPDKSASGSSQGSQVVNGQSQTKATYPATFKNDLELIQWLGQPTALSLHTNADLHTISGVDAAEAFFLKKRDAVLKSKNFAGDFLALCRDVSNKEASMGVSITFAKATNPKDLMARLGPPKGTPKPADKDGGRWLAWTDMATVRIEKDGITALIISCTEYVTRGSIVDYRRDSPSTPKLGKFNKVLLNADKIASRTAHGSSVWALAVSPGGGLLASGSSDREVKIWSLPEGKLLKTLRPEAAFDENSAVYNLAFSQDGKYLVAGCGGKMSVFLSPSWALAALRPGPHGNQRRLGLLVRSNEAVCVVNVRNPSDDAYNRVLFVPLIKGDPEQFGQNQPTPPLVGGLAVSSDQKHLLLYDYRAAVQVWSLDQKKLVKAANLGSIWALAISPKNDEFVYGGSDGTVRRVAFPSLEAKGSLKSHEGSVHAVAFSPDGSLLATGGDDKMVAIWSLSDGKLLRTLKGHPRRVSDVVFAGQGKLLISSAGGTIIIWELTPPGRRWMLYDIGL